MKTRKQETGILSYAAMYSAAIVLLAAFNHPVYAGARYWVGGSGNWLDTNNWSLGPGGSPGATPPAGGDSARVTLDDSIDRIITYDQPSSFTLTNFWIDNQGTGGLELLQTQYALNAGSGIIGRFGAATVSLSGGNLDITSLLVGSETGSSGTINLSGTGVLDASTFRVGNNGGGIVSQTGGTANANFMTLGFQSGTGTYTLDAGALNTINTTVTNGLFTQNGGTHTATGIVSVGGNGIYNMNGGMLDVDSLSGANFNFSGGTLMANTLSGGSYTLDGVATTLLNVATVNGGTYNISNAQSFGFTTINGGQFNVSGNSTLNATTTTGGSYNISGASTLNATDLGISAGLTLSADSALNVANVTLDAGTLETSGATLEFATLTQNGGTLNPSITVDAPDTFTYNGGTFNGSLTNNGQTGLNASFTSGASTVNNGTVDLLANRTLTANGTGLDNSGTLNMSGGTLTGTGALVNDGNVNSNGFVNIAGSGGFANNGQFTLSSGAFTLGNSGPNTNSGALNLAFQNDMIMNAGLANSGELNLNGGNLSGPGSLTNTVGGALNGAGAVTTDIVNSGTVNAQSGNLILAGSNFTNTGLVKNSVGSNLFINAASVTHTGSIEVNAAGSVVFSGNVTNTTGENVTMNGGALSTGGLSNDSGAAIAGFGSLTGDLTNAGSVDFFGQTSLVGDLGNQSTGHFLARNDQTLITGHTTNDGTIETLNGEIIFEGGLTNNGALLFDPSIITLTTLEVGLDGYLAETGEPGDRFIVQEDFIIASDENSLWSTENTIFQFNGGTHDAGNPQTLEVTGIDIGDIGSGWIDNFMLGTLQIGTSNTFVQLVDESDNSGSCLSEYCEIWSSEALYVGDLILEAGTTLDLAGFNLYVMNDFLDNGGVVLNGTVTVASAVPVPAAFYLFGSGLLGLAGVARRRRRDRMM